MRTGLVVVVAWILLSVPFGIMVGRWLAGRDRMSFQEWVGSFPQPDPPYDWALEERCACPIARVSEDILQDGRLCPDPPDGEDGLCSSCRHGCQPLLKAFRDWRQGVHRD